MCAAHSSPAIVQVGFTINVKYHQVLPYMLVFLLLEKPVNSCQLNPCLNRVDLKCTWCLIAFM